MVAHKTLTLTKNIGKTASLSTLKITLQEIGLRILAEATLPVVELSILAEACDISP